MIGKIRSNPSPMCCRHLTYKNKINVAFILECIGRCYRSLGNQSGKGGDVSHLTPFGVGNENAFWRTVFQEVHYSKFQLLSSFLCMINVYLPTLVGRVHFPSFKSGIYAPKHFYCNLLFAKPAIKLVVYLVETSLKSKEHKILEAR